MKLTTTSPIKLSEIRKILRHEGRIRHATEKRARAVKWMLQHQQLWEGYPVPLDRLIKMRRGLVKDGVWNKNTGVSNDYFDGLVSDARLVRRINAAGGLKAICERNHMLI